MLFIKKLIPIFLLKAIRPVYHGLMAVLASWYYGRPGRKMIVIGVTGTAGKSTTVKMLAHILNNAKGREITEARMDANMDQPLPNPPLKRGGNRTRCGYVTTVSFSDGDREYINKHGLSMPGGPLLQKQLHQMAASGCYYAIVECTSEGLAQNRHLGIRFSGAVMTNLSPAHQDAHGSFENYRAAKGKLFQTISNIKYQISKGSSLKSFFVINLDDTNADYFLQFKAQNKTGVTHDQNKKNFYKLDRIALYGEVRSGQQLSFTIDGVDFELPMVGEFNALNAALAALAAENLGISIEQSSEALKTFAGAAGRMEEIKNDKGFRVFVDYAPEPAAMEASLGAVSKLPHSKIIHVFGSTGGHRDVAKRFAFGRISARAADVIFITNDDVYDSDPEQIAQNIQEGIASVDPSERKVQQILTVLDRKTAIKEALTSARLDNIILITGKGSEQFLVLPGNNRIAWDEREVVRDLLTISAGGGSAFGGNN